MRPDVDLQAVLPGVQLPAVNTEMTLLRCAHVGNDRFQVTGGQVVRIGVVKGGRGGSGVVDGMKGAHSDGGWGRCCGCRGGR